MSLSLKMGHVKNPQSNPDSNSIPWSYGIGLQNPGLWRRWRPYSSPLLPWPNLPLTSLGSC